MDASVFPLVLLLVFVSQTCFAHRCKTALVTVCGGQQSAVSVSACKESCGFGLLKLSKE